jgi:hypothetical protein
VCPDIEDPTLLRRSLHAVMHARIGRPVGLALRGTRWRNRGAVVQTLAMSYVAGVHIAVDDLRCNVVSGRANPDPDRPASLVDQIRMARHNALDIAARYRAAEAFTLLLVSDTLGDLEAKDLTGVLFASVPARPRRAKPSGWQRTDSDRSPQGCEAHARHRHRVERRSLWP